MDAASGEGLPGANVVFIDLKRGTATGPDGGFSFADLPRGRFTVHIRYLGYNTLTRTVDTGNGQPLDARLTTSTTESGPVVVTGVSQATEMRRSPGPTTVVDRTRLSRTSGTNIIDAIAHTPGVSQITTGAASSKPVLRGLGFNRVVTLNNGARQEGQQPPRSNSPSDFPTPSRLPFLREKKHAPVGCAGRLSYYFGRRSACPRYISPCKPFNPRKPLFFPPLLSWRRWAILSISTT